LESTQVGDVIAELVSEFCITLVMYDAHAALRIGLVERDGASFIGEDWEHPGNYILLDLLDPDGGWGCYVGKAPGGVRTRLLSHLRTKDHWRRAL
jgi:hypothetical protein